MPKQKPMCVFLEGCNHIFAVSCASVRDPNAIPTQPPFLHPCWRVRQLILVFVNGPPELVPAVRLVCLVGGNRAMAKSLQVFLVGAAGHPVRRPRAAGRVSRRLHLVSWRRLDEPWVEGFCLPPSTRVLETCGSSFPAQGFLQLCGWQKARIRRVRVFMWAVCTTGTVSGKKASSSL